MNFEMNNVRKDLVSDKITKNSPVVEVFTALVKGESLERFGNKGDIAVKYIKDLGARAENGDWTAVTELNTIRRFAVEAPVLEEIKLLGVFGDYQNVGFDETIEREIYTHAGETAREQAAVGDVVFPTTVKETYSVPTFNVSGGYAVDYRRVANGDMSRENKGLELVKTDILNSAKRIVIKKVYEAIKNATGVKYFYEYAGITKTGVDDVLNKVRRSGKPTIVGDYAVLSQFNGWAGYKGTVDGTTITGISEKTMQDIAQTGLIASYNGALLVEVTNPYNEYKLNAAGTDFIPVLPAGLAFILPTGGTSPIATWTRGGLTSFTGNDVKTGQILTRFDLECAVDVAKGHEHKIGVIYDTNVGGID